ncbi:putative acetyltransferase [gamma proteobacterium IMCC1989]|nr:putative acetyltransferase [gamma proteobacterium IMCC1989]
MNRTVFLEGNRCKLTVLSKDDYEQSYFHWLHDRDVTYYLTRGTYPTSIEQIRNSYDDVSNNPNELELGIINKEDNKLIGVAGLHCIQAIARSAEFRILIGEKQYWGLRLGKEVLQMLIIYGMEILNLNKVWLGVSNENDKAFRSYLSCGFTAEGTLREEIFRNGRFYDVTRMSILKNEYIAHRESWPTYSCILKKPSL